MGGRGVILKIPHGWLPSTKKRVVGGEADYSYPWSTEEKGGGGRRRWGKKEMRAEEGLTSAALKPSTRRRQSTH